MRAHHHLLLLATLLVPSAVLSLPTTSPDSSIAVAVAVAAAGVFSPTATATTCAIVPFPATPTDPPACWSWLAADAASDYCGASTFAAIPSASVAEEEKQGEGDWLADCAAAPRGDFFLADYVPGGAWNALLARGRCRFEVALEVQPGVDQVYIGGRDVADLLASAAGVLRGGEGGGVMGQVRCGVDDVRWRVVPGGA
ncbi:hypothetical protein F4780DRAFT_722093 [Xylariomycetidae sp. FL0641]|nr:hypothetical protein F4780DRAFT_722093 [Xylariomycetidae sp. FL0641]